MYEKFVLQDCETGFFTTTEENKDIADNNYPNAPVQRFVAKSFGDELPDMRDDLIRRKNNSEGIIRRHWNAWRTLDNWKVNRNNDKNIK